MPTPAKQSPPERKTTTMRLQTDILDALEKEAAERGLSRTHLVQLIATRWLRGLKKGHRIDLGNPGL